MTEEVQTAAEQQQAAAQMQVAAEQMQQVAANPAQQVAAAAPAPEVVPPSPEDVAAKRNAENLQRAMEKGGYVPEPEPSLQERAVALLNDMQHAVDHNAPISQAMMAEARALIGGVAT